MMTDHAADLTNLIRIGNDMGHFKEIWDFLRVRKKWWLAPIIVVLLLLSLIIILTQGSVLAPFLYAIF
jgi:hypothetical protein